MKEILGHLKKECDGDLGAMHTAICNSIMRVRPVLEESNTEYLSGFFDNHLQALQKLKDIRDVVNELSDFEHHPEYIKKAITMLRKRGDIVSGVSKIDDVWMAIKFYPDGVYMFPDTYELVNEDKHNVIRLN